MFVLYKLLGQLVLPLPAGLLALAAMVALSQQKAAKIAAAGLLVAIWLLSCPLVGRSLLRLVDDRVPRRPVDSLPAADAVVVLSGGFPDRELCALQLQRLGKAPVVIFSGRISELNAARLKDLIALARLTPQQVVLEQTSRTTVEGGEALAGIARTRGWRSVLLVSHAYHQRRALRNYHSADLVVIPALCPELRLPPREDMRRRPREEKLLDLLPGADGLRYTNLALRELLGAALQR